MQEILRIDNDDDAFESPSKKSNHQVKDANALRAANATAAETLASWRPSASKRKRSSSLAHEEVIDLTTSSSPPALMFDSKSRQMATNVTETNLPPQTMFGVLRPPKAHGPWKRFRGEQSLPYAHQLEHPDQNHFMSAMTKAIVDNEPGKHGGKHNNDTFDLLNAIEKPQKTERRSLQVNLPPNEVQIQSSERDSGYNEDSMQFHMIEMPQMPAIRGLQPNRPQGENLTQSQPPSNRPARKYLSSLETTTHVPVFYYTKKNDKKDGKKNDKKNSHQTKPLRDVPYHVRPVAAQPTSMSASHLSSELSSMPSSDPSPIAPSKSATLPPPEPVPEPVSEPVASGPAIQPYGTRQIGSVRAHVSREAFKANQAVVPTGVEQPEEIVTVAQEKQMFVEAQQVVTDTQHERANQSVDARKEIEEERKQHGDNKTSPMTLGSPLLEPVCPPHIQPQTTIQFNQINTPSLTSLQHPPPRPPQPAASASAEPAKVAYTAPSPTSRGWQSPRRGRHRRVLPSNTPSSELSELPDMSSKLPEVPQLQQANMELLPVFDSLRARLGEQDHALQGSGE